MNDIDDIFKDAALNEQATFKPEYWEQYAEQFNGEKKKQKGVFGFFLGGLVLVSALIFINDYNDNNIDVINDLVNSSVIENTQNKQEVVQKALVVNALTNKIKPDDNLVSNTLVNENKNHFVSSNKKSNEDKTDKLGVSKSDISISGTESSDNNILPNNVLLGSNLKQEKTKKEADLFKNTNDSNPLDLDKVKEEKELLKNQTVYIEKTNEVEIEKSNSEIDSTNNEPTINSIVENTENVDSSINSLKKSAKKSSVVKRGKLNKLQFNFQFGGIAYNDFSLAQASTNLKTGLFAGIEVEYMLKPYLTLSLGVNGYNRNSDGLYIEFQHLDNGFGEVNSKKTYSYTDLYFIEVPVNFNYVLNSRHKIGVGPTFTRLLTTKVNLNEETKDVQNNSSTKSNSNELLYHYNTFELNNVGLNVNYQFMYNRVGINIGYTQGINEFLNKNTFNSSKLNSLSKLNLSIKYKL
ncbi:hypothetical protein N9544_06980 [Flavobacteriales bacterium]|nr:hypothetical protein [Flavobacteriales bacterium]